MPLVKNAKSHCVVTQMVVIVCSLPSVTMSTQWPAESLNNGFLSFSITPHLLSSNKWWVMTFGMLTGQITYTRQKLNPHKANSLVDICLAIVQNAVTSTSKHQIHFSESLFVLSKLGHLKVQLNVHCTQPRLRTSPNFKSNSAQFLSSKDSDIWVFCCFGGVTTTLSHPHQL